MAWVDLDRAALEKQSFFPCIDWRRWGSIGDADIQWSMASVLMPGR
jgi:hypothetical protein